MIICYSRKKKKRVNECTLCSSLAPMGLPKPWALPFLPCSTCPSLPGELLLILQNPSLRSLFWDPVPTCPGVGLAPHPQPQCPTAHPRGRHPGFSVLSPVGTILGGRRLGAVHSESLMPRTVPDASQDVGKQLVNDWGSEWSRSWGL